jgi:hypothetical protein|tara:strand:- start:3288 stop:3485 length:198 start_codon:yes stop_codon:yes gene_type:complete
MLGKLMNNIPNKIELPLDIAIKDLKKYKRDLPFNLYSLTAKQVNSLKRMFAIIEGMEVPEKMTKE